jgi:putative intracellular protease/amidase
MTRPCAHVAVHDALADWEVAHLLVELRTGRFTVTPWTIVTVSESREQITTMGGLRVVPDALVEGLDPADSDLLVLPGGEMWDTGPTRRHSPP